MNNLESYVKKQIRLEQVQQRKYIKQQQQAIVDKMCPKEFSMPLSLQFELTGRCNCNCLHCYNRSGDLPKDLMTPLRWKELATEIVEFGGIFECIVSGGEPLMLKDELIKIMDILHEDGTSFMLITNALLMTKSKIKELKKYRFRWIQISIDGSNADIHDNLRQIRGSWDKAVNAALMVADVGIPLAIANTVTPATLDDLQAMVQLAYSCGASSLITGEVFPSGRGAQNEALLLTNEQRAYLWKSIEEQQKLYAGRMIIRRSMSNKIQLESASELPMTRCLST